MKHSILVEKLQGKRSFRRPRHRWEIIVKWILRDYDMVWAVCVWINMRISAGSCEQYSGSSYYIKGWAFLIQFRDC
jgi:hypothetical protein